jgi:hypothetical protein
MDMSSLKEILNNLHLKCQVELDELRNKDKEDVEWLSEISAEIDKHTSESSILLPKTPTALWKRCLEETIPEDRKLDTACSWQNVVSPSISFDTRITCSSCMRGINQSLEVISPVLNKRSRRQASKAAGANIKQQLKKNLLLPPGESPIAVSSSSSSSSSSVSQNPLRCSVEPWLGKNALVQQCYTTQ